MWMDIDPHLLLFTMLPTLLAGDAMTIDTSVAKRVGKQCMYLAGPGVIIAAGLCALFLMAWFNWSFLLSLTTSSILCATDPVAVVALLKELGASPTLTVQIQGESLLNDGTAIVLYTGAYDMLSGETYDVADIGMFLVKTALLAIGLGVFLGYLFFSWIRTASDRFNHHAPIIQTLLTLCAAYWSFVLAEGVFAMSGVLATVGCSLVLAHHMWPFVVQRAALLDFWHALENLGNIIIFFLGGALCGAAMVHIEAIDYLNLIVVYFVLLILRGSLIFASRPLLQRLHKDKEALTPADALVMTWGGLRGAVGLALAIQVQHGRAVGSDGVYRISEDDANRVLFFVSGIAFLTTCVNATTCPYLVDYLGITNVPEAEARLLQKFNEQLLDHSRAANNPEEVNALLERMLEGVCSSLRTSRATVVRPSSMPEQGARRLSLTGNGTSQNPVMQPAEQIILEYESGVKAFAQIPQGDLSQLLHIPTDLDGQVANMIDLLRESEPDIVMCKIINNTFLTMVSTQYWNHIEQGNLKPGSPEADMLFTSIRSCQLNADLVDYMFLTQSDSAESGDDGEFAKSRPRLPKILATGETDEVTAESTKMESDEDALGDFVNSSRFTTACGVAIALNVLWVIIEEVGRGDDESSIWIVMEGTFCFLFFFEFVIKLAHYKLDYFQSMWNSFDFSLVIVGFLGFGMSIAASGSNEGTSQTRVVRISRVLRTLRFFRFFRLFHAMMGRDPLISPELAELMRRMTALSSFVSAHLSAQKGMLKFFTGEIDDSNEVEVSRAVIQSLIAVHKAVQELVTLTRQMPPELVVELQHMRERKRIVEELKEFVLGALANGAITASNAGSLLHPLDHELAHCIQSVNQLSEGQVAGMDSHTLSHALAPQAEEAQVATLPDHANKTGGNQQMPLKSQQLSGGDNQGPTGIDEGDAAAGVNSTASMKTEVGAQLGVTSERGAAAATKRWPAKSEDDPEDSKPVTLAARGNWQSKSPQGQEDSTPLAARTYGKTRSPSREADTPTDGELLPTSPVASSSEQLVETKPDRQAPGEEEGQAKKSFLAKKKKKVVKSPVRGLVTRMSGLESSPLVDGAEEVEDGESP
jgi:NhaP-type Na+/H+ or K+/H+ antiporter